MRRLLVAFVLSVLTVPFAQAKSVALVIGNDGYANVPSLQKAVNDARSISAELERLGFIVRRVENVDQRAMSRAIVAFNADVEAGDRAVFFYSGHGFEIGGTNYLLPTDVPAARSSEEDLVRDASFPVDRIIDGVRAKGASVAIMILDACRDNPFAGPGTRSAPRTKGLARVDAPEGVFVLMSAGAKQEALDRLSDADANPNSVFTRTFLTELSKPGQTLVQIAKKTQVEVKTLARSVGHDQTPAYYDQVIGDIVLSGAADSGQSGEVAALADPLHVSPNVPTQLNTSANTQAGAGVQLGLGVQIGPGVIIGGKDAKIALQDPANAPKPGAEQGRVLAQGGNAAGSTQLAMVRPDPSLGGLTQQSGGRAPIANFMRSNSGWTVTLSTPEPATAISYRVGDKGEFRDTGLLDVLDQRTGQRMPNPSFQLSGKAQAALIQVRYQTSEGAMVGPFPIRFDPDVALFDTQRKALESIWPSWVEFREFNGLLVYFTTLTSYRCAITEVRYGLDGADPLRRFDLPACNTRDPYSIPENANLILKVPPSTKSISVKITWKDGTQSDVNTIERE
jgi:hypothetical protein